ncbi:hypothetical protein AB0G15_32675 [Streptosporangium sp. NPDC023825]
MGEHTANRQQSKIKILVPLTIIAAAISATIWLRRRPGQPIQVSVHV